jgi:archaemetzincin
MRHDGSNSLEESDRQPIHLCPVCLKKLAHVLKFDVVRRYHDLLSFYSAEHFDEEAEWLRVRLSRLGESIERAE